VFNGAGIKRLVAGMAEDEVGFLKRPPQHDPVGFLVPPVLDEELQQGPSKVIRRRLWELFGSLISKMPCLYMTNYL